MINRQLMWDDREDNRLLYIISNRAGSVTYHITLEFLTQSAFGFFGTLRFVRDEFILLYGDPTRAEQPVGIMLGLVRGVDYFVGNEYDAWVRKAKYQRRYSRREVVK